MSVARLAASRIAKAAAPATLRGSLATRLGNCKYSTHPAAAVVSPVPSFVLAQPATKVTKLPNGIRVASEDGHGETATVGVYIDAGSVYENDKNNGTAHFLEHMAFKGTSNRSQQQLELEVENCGAQLNAYTSREQTVYIARSLKQDAPKMLDIIGDILQNSTLSADAIDRERHTILTEKSKVEENKEEVLFDYLHAAAYAGTPLARTILGDTHNIQKITRDDLASYIKTHYIAPRLVVAASGAVNHDQLVAQVGRVFGNMPTQSDFDYGSVGNVEFTGSSITVRDDDEHDPHIAIAFESVPWSDPDYVAFMILQTIIGSWDRSQGGGANLTSRVAELVAEKDLVHNYQAFNTFYNRTGLFGIVMQAYYNKVDTAVATVMNQIQAIGKGLKEVDLERAKSKFKAGHVMQLDGSYNVTEEIGRQMLTIGRRMTSAELFMRVDALKPSDIMRVCDQYLNDVDPVLSAYGNLKFLPDYNELRGLTYWSKW